MRRPLPPLALIAAVCGLVLVVGCGGARNGVAVDQSAAAPQLDQLSESLLIDEAAVPPLAGASWGQIVGAPQGVEPSVSPAECGLFLTHGTASQRAMALRSAGGAAIGAELAITEASPDLAALLNRCSTYRFDIGPTQTVVEIESLPPDRLPADTIRAVQHCRRTGQGRTVAWDIAMIAGYRRGVLVIAEYTPGPGGNGFDEELAASLTDIYLAQIAKVDNA